MRRAIPLILVALVLAVAGAVCLRVGTFERRMGVAQEDMAVLDFADPQADYAALQQDLEKRPWLARASLADIRRRRAALQYWQGNYGDLVELARTPPPSQTEAAEPADPAMLLMAANASFRDIQHGPQDKATLLKRLDEVIHAYAESLRAGSESPDAAFNYELVVKLREELANGKRKGLPTGTMAADKTDSNMHGDPGEPPKEMKVEQFQIRVPMDPKDFRSSQDQNAGTGQARRRKG